MNIKNSNKRVGNEEIQQVEFIDTIGTTGLIEQPSTEIFFYSDVTTNSLLTLRKQINSSIKYIKILRIQNKIDYDIPIHLYISSHGGELAPAIALSDIIKNSEIPIYTYVEGLAASAATFLSVAGHKRFITPNSTMLIHQLSGESSGNYKLLSDDNKNFQLWMHLVKNFYSKNTKLTKKQLHQLLESDLLLNASLCKKYGLVDEIL